MESTEGIGNEQLVISKTNAVQNVQYSKLRAAELANDLVEKVKEGELDPIKLGIQLDFIAKVAEDAKSQIKSEIIAEVEKYGKSYEGFNYKIEVKEVGVKYDYSVCGHPRWNELNKQLKSIKAEMKEIETFLKTIKKPIVMASEDTEGEEIKLNPPKKIGSTSPAFTLKK